MHHIRTVILVAMLSLVGLGCGGSSDSGKNKNKDVPKSAEPAPAK